MRSPIRWFGSKGNMTAKLLPLFPLSHHTYVEPFGGGASMLFVKPPSPVEVYNDLDSGLVNFFRVLRDPDKFEQFYRKAALTPYAREEFNFCRKTWADCEDDVERAYRFFVTARMSFGGKLIGASFGSVVTTSRRGMAGMCSAWLSAIDQLPQISERLLRVQIEHQDWRVILERYDTDQTLFYLDPPYIHSTRRGGKYAHEMTDEDHIELVERLLNIKGMAILSGYASEIYRPLEDAGWMRKDWQTVCYATVGTRGSGLQGKGSALKKQPRTETAWVSHNCLAWQLF